LRVGPYELDQPCPTARHNQVDLAPQPDHFAHQGAIRSRTS
jgi:hypothetical protein